MLCNPTADTNKKKALLLHNAGLEVQEVYFDDPNREAAVPATSDAYKETIKLLDKHFKPIVSIPHERALFRKMAQKDGESIIKFSRRLRHHGGVCDYGNALELRITEQIYDGTSSNALREAILKKRLVELNDILEEGRVLETIDHSHPGLAAMEEQVDVNRVRSGQKQCFRCGSFSHYANDKKCPARKKTCDKCGIIGHYKKFCKTKSTTSKKKKVRQVDDTDDSDDVAEPEVDSDDSTDSDIQHIFSATLVHSSGSDSVHPVFTFGDKYNTKIPCIVGGVKIQWIIDSGASVNVIGEKTWKKLKKQNCKVSYESDEPRKKLLAYGNHRLLVKGVFKTDINHGSSTVHREIYVVEGNGTNLLGKTTSIDLGVLQIKQEVMQISDKIPQIHMATIGKAKDVLVTINVDRSVHPIQQACRRLPIPLQQTVEEELKKLLDQDIIEPASNKITWASPLVVTPKDGGRRVRLCVDMRKANSAIIPQRHPLPTFDEIMPHLDGCKVFSKVDLNQAFHQLELHPDSRDITTFVTPKAYYRFKRLMFGMNCSAEIFQRELERILKGLDGIRHFIDDVLVFGRNKAEHDRRLSALLKRLEEYGLTINMSKCQFGRSSVTFMEHELQENGILPAHGKLATIKSFRHPESAEEVRSFLGLANYVGKFIPKLASISTPLREMIQDGARFRWTDDTQKAFDAIKAALSNPQHLGYYNPESDTTLIVDASATGLGAVLLQTDRDRSRIISYASKSLSKTERKYSALDKEAMAIYWGVGRFDMYLRGKFFTILTDHKPLLNIFDKDSSPNARQQRWILQLQGYRFKLLHVPGKKYIADPLSRLAQTVVVSSCDKDCEKDLCAIIESTLPQTVTMSELIRQSEADEEIQRIHSAIRISEWTSELKRYQPFQSAFCSVGQVVLRNNKIVVPFELRKQVLDLAHTGHPGSSKMKRRLRAALWWPGIDAEVEQKCKNCLECQAVGKQINPEPLIIREMPTKAWSHLCADFLGPLPNGKFIFVMVDFYSRYVVVEIMTKITSAAVIQRLEQIFTRLGLPDVLKTDNAANFCSQEFRDYCTDNGIKLTHTTPYWPAANGEVER
ncbi:uncharacterized protein K02A2.6-like [Armigeres subalbatus]|uniref:uncharacterized protein K02A2.6-like n=1 Tax=Armigeres subalbatus TaxID=124917 RepID=UPI002ED19B4D